MTHNVTYMTGYTKLFESILDSTVWLTPPATRLTWITMLAMADQYGVVEAAIPGLARRAGVSDIEAEAAIKCFLSPDPYSRTKDHEGRRIVEVDGGWRLLNHGKYREKMSAAEMRAKAAERAARYRERHATRHATSRSVTPRHSESRSSRQAEAYAEAKEEKREGATDVAPHSKPSAPTKQVSSAHVQEWNETLGAVFERSKRAAPKATRDQTWQLAERCRDLARVHGVTFAEAAQKLAEAALTSTEKFPFSVMALDPYAAAQTAPGAPGESWEAYQERKKNDPWAGIKQ